MWIFRNAPALFLIYFVFLYHQEVVFVVASGTAIECVDFVIHDSLCN